MFLIKYWQKQEINLEQIFQFKRLCIIGKTGCGKTDLVKQLAQHIFNTHAVYYFSNSFKHFSRPTVKVVPYKFGASHPETYKDYQELIKNLKEIKSQISNQPIALILDELKFFSESPELTDQLFAIFREYSYQDTIIIVSQTSRTISKHWGQYHKLLGCLTQREREEIKGISRKYSQGNEVECIRPHKPLTVGQYPGWLEKATELQRGGWLLDELNQPLCSKVLKL